VVTVSASGPCPAWLSGQLGLSTHHSTHRLATFGLQEPTEPTTCPASGLLALIEQPPAQMAQAEVRWLNALAKAD